MSLRTLLSGIGERRVKFEECVESNSGKWSESPDVVEWNQKQSLEAEVPD